MVRSRAVQNFLMPIEPRPVTHTITVVVDVPRWKVLLALGIVQAVTLGLTLGLYLRPYLTL